MPRLNFLDGLRGWGAVFVVLYHVFSEALPVDAAVGERLPYFVPFNGTLAVLVFFLVSGFSLSVRYLADGDIPSWLGIAAGRYLRLAVPIFAACLLVHLAMLAGAFDAAADRLPKFSHALNFEPTTGHLVKFALFDVFFNYRFSDSYIGPLVTMSIELLGSFLTLLAVLAVRPLPGRSLLLAGLGAAVVWMAADDATAMLALFLAGAATADWFNRGWIHAIPKPVAFALLATGCLVPALLPYSVAVWGLIATSSLVIGCIAVPQIRSVLSGKLAGELGRISFPLYLMHGPVMYLVGEPLTRSFGTTMPLRFGIDILVIAVSFAAAWLFLPVNSLAIRLSRAAGRLVTHDGIPERLYSGIPASKGGPESAATIPR